MARVKRAVNGKKHRRAVLEQAQGYYGNRSRSFRSANEAVMHALQYAYRDRRAAQAAATVKRRTEDNGPTPVGASEPAPSDAPDGPPAAPADQAEARSGQQSV